MSVGGILIVDVGPVLSEVGWLLVESPTSVDMESILEVDRLVSALETAIGIPLLR